MSDSAPSNLQELTVSALSQALKRTIETTYDRVRVRGELGRVTIARSGHMYADIKDDKAVLNTVMWKGQVNRLPFRPEEGLEIIATGRLSTYPGRSNYQLIAEDMRPAGVGALMALLEERKKKLAAEGLFDKSHKQPLPYLPNTIGVVTSPTGAVIRDILHRVRERFPCQVILWPALVQGDAAAAQIEAGIRGFNALQGADRPDVLIVGRGGGSIEDLWPFNEESVVRAAFESTIPLISAVGHETDTTLIDYVADARAPTPTGAAEIAVPVRTDLLLRLRQLGERQAQGLYRLTQQAKRRLEASRLPRPERLLEFQRQKLDHLTERLPKALMFGLQQLRAQLERLPLLTHAPDRTLALRKAQLTQTAHGLGRALQHAISRQSLRLQGVASRLHADRLSQKIQAERTPLDRLWGRAETAERARLDRLSTRLNQELKLLDTLSYQATLKRGYALIKTPDGQIVRTAEAARQHEELEAFFQDSALPISTRPGATGASIPDSGSKTKRSSRAKTQGDLF